MEERSPHPAILGGLIALAIVSISTAAILIRLSEAPTLIIAFYRLALATVLLGTVAMVRRRARGELRALARRDLFWLGVVGVVLAIHFWSWIASLALTTVAASVVLVTLHPVFVGLVSGRVYGEGLARAGWLGVVVALVGGVVIAGTDFRIGPRALLGDGLALVGGVAAALYFVAGRGFRQRLSLLSYVVPVYGAAALTLLLLALVNGDALTGYPRREYVLFVALAVVPMILGHTLLNYALRHVTAPVIATTVLGEPVGSTLLAIVILAELPPLGTLVGGLVVLVGIALVVLARQPRGPQRKTGTG